MIGIDVDDLPDALVAPTSEAETSTSLPSAPASAGGNVEPSVVGQAKASPRQSVVTTLEDAMKVSVQRSLEFARGDCARAARLLGISRPAIYRKMARYGITSASLRQLREQTARSAADGGQ